MDAGPHIVWRAPEWLAAFGNLTKDNVMDYFALSPFFDKSSSNAQLRMQMAFSRGGMHGVDEENELKKFVGIEYVVAHVSPADQRGSLFAIHKRERTSPNESRVLAVYYVLNDNIYQSPSLYNVINERVLASEHALGRALEGIKSVKPVWQPESHYAYVVKESKVDDSNGHSNELNGEAQVDVSSERDEDDQHPATAFNPLLFRALQATAASYSQLEAPTTAALKTES